MKLGILGPGEKSISLTSKRIIEEAKKDFKQTDIIPVTDVELKVDEDIEACFGKKSLTEYDYILTRIDSVRAAIGYPIVRFLDHLGIRKPYPAETILIAHNKFLTLQVLAKNRVPIPLTFMTGSKTAAAEILKKLKLPIIIKLLAGFGGQGVMLMETREAALSTIETMKTLQQEILLEEVMPNPGEDIRGFVVGDEVIASFKRVAALGETKANIKSGGRGIPYRLTEEMEDIAIRSARAVQAKIVAIDMMESRDGPKVIEVNINPGLQGIESATNINIAKRIVDFIKSEIIR